MYSKLFNKIIWTERQYWANVQYSRRECLEGVGIPQPVNNDKLEERVCDIFQEIGVNLSPDNLETSHRRKNKDRAMVKLLRRRDYEQVLHIKKDLKGINTIDLNFPEDCKIFFNESLCSYYRCLCSECKKL